MSSVLNMTDCLDALQNPTPPMSYMTTGTRQANGTFATTPTTPAVMGPTIILAATAQK